MALGHSVQPERKATDCALLESLIERSFASLLDGAIIVYNLVVEEDG